MEALSLASIAIVPTLCWLVWLRWHDRRSPEPRRLVVRALAAGGASTALVLLVRPLVEAQLPIGTDWRGATVDAFVVTATIEESAKLLALLLAVAWHRAWDEPLDGLVYGAAVGLGFAAVENARYLMQTGEAGLVLARGATATLVHLAATGGLGLLLWRARRGSAPQRVMWTALALCAAVTVHGAYDVFLLKGEGELGWISLVVVLPVTLALLAWKVASAQAHRDTGAPTRTTSPMRPSAPTSTSDGTPARSPSEV